MWVKNKQPGFTIVELLIVIVIIAILATIVVVAYNGIKARAIDSSLKNDASNGATVLANDNTTTGTYPSSFEQANGGKGVKSSGSNYFVYRANTNNNPATYTLTVGNDDSKKHIPSIKS